MRNSMSTKFRGPPPPPHYYVFEIEYKGDVGRDRLVDQHDPDLLES
jgi:hypothetical protein